MSYILILEPDKIIANSISEKLTRLNYEVKVCTNAQDAIVNIDKKIPELILLEVMLPRHNGIEFIYEVRSYPDWQNIPVVIFSFVRKSDLIGDLKLINDLGIESIEYKPEKSTTSLVEKIDKIIHDKQNI